MTYIRNILNKSLYHQHLISTSWNWADHIHPHGGAVPSETSRRTSLDFCLYSALGSDDAGLGILEVPQRKRNAFLIYDLLQLAVVHFLKMLMLEQVLEAT